MSTSPEAKQAAEEWVAPVEITSFREAYAYGYDAATAKSQTRRGELREELEGLMRIIAADTKQIQQLAHQQPSRRPVESRPYEEWSWREQQPSTPSLESLMTPEQAKAWSEHCGRAFDTMDELNRKPTPDVEKSTYT